MVINSATTNLYTPQFSFLTHTSLITADTKSKLPSDGNLVIDAGALPVFQQAGRASSKGAALAMSGASKQDSIFGSLTKTDQSKITDLSKYTETQLKDMVAKGKITQAQADAELTRRKREKEALKQAAEKAAEDELKTPNTLSSNNPLAKEQLEAQKLETLEYIDVYA